MYQRTPIEKVEDATIPGRIDSLLGNGLLNDWEKNFCTSIKAGYEKYKSLTKGQYNTFLNVEKRYDATAIAERNTWAASFDAEKAANWKTMMEYYSATSYYKGAVSKYRENNNYIPSENEYKAVCENKYSLKYLEQRKNPAKYKQGQLVVHKYWGTYKLATVLSIGDVSSWVKGSRIYKVLHVGAVQPCEALEKEMLYYRESLITKLEKPGEEIPF